MILLEGTRVLGIQFKNTLEDLFQQSQENIIVFNRSKERESKQIELGLFLNHSILQKKQGQA